MRDKESSNINIKHRNLHCFFDIDSTLTTGDAIINSNIKNVFDDMKQKNIRIYFVSGRSVPQIRQDMNEFETEPYGIAENGGIIIGIGNSNEFRLGNRKEPDKFDSYLKKHCKKIKEDISQGMRKTERIYHQTISRAKLDEYLKKSKAKVEIHQSQNSFHVSKIKANKGTGIKKLTSEISFGHNDLVVAVGDADMDIPMFEHAYLSFAVGNASPGAIKAADWPLNNEHDKGIEELFKELKKLI